MTTEGTTSSGAAAAGRSRLRDVVRVSAGVCGVLVTGDASGCNSMQTCKTSVLTGVTAYNEKDFCRFLWKSEVIHVHSRIFRKNMQNFRVNLSRCTQSRLYARVHNCGDCNQLLLTGFCDDFTGDRACWLS